MKKNFLVLSLLALVVTGCGRDMSGTYTGTQTISQSLGASSQKSVSMQVTDTSGTITAYINSLDGSSGQLKGKKTGGDSIGDVQMSLVQSLNLVGTGGQSGGVNNPGILCQGTIQLQGACSNPDGDTLDCNLSGQCPSTGGIYGGGGGVINYILHASKVDSAEKK